ncbi:hypothetical protein GCM10027160_28140 [Streptomyces calidiresistens]
MAGVDHGPLGERAERRGLVARGRSSEDRRVIEVFITPEGGELAERVMEEIRTALAPFTGRPGARDRHELARLLDVVSGAATGPHGEAGPAKAP